MSRIYVDADTVRHIVRDEINNDKYRTALFSSLFGSSKPISREQANDLVEGKIGTFSMTIPTLVNSEVVKLLLHNSGINSIFAAHCAKLQQDLNTHSGEVGGKMRKNLYDLTHIHEIQLMETKRAMNEASKETVNKILCSDEGGAIIKCIEDKVRSDQNTMFYGSIFASLAAGVIGGFIGMGMRR